ncbi:hypothetical protein NUH87_30820 [Pseudomonas batumici]|uniref:hypothetical protein n=1 Tax=Pseudomonas batumici TaxID=226910 RepID=UPI0030D291C5
MKLSDLFLWTSSSGLSLGPVQGSIGDDSQGAIKRTLKNIANVNGGAGELNVIGPYSLVLEAARPCTIILDIEEKYKNSELLPFRLQEGEVSKTKEKPDVIDSFKGGELSRLFMESAARVKRDVENSAVEETTASAAETKLPSGVESEFKAIEESGYLQVVDSVLLQAVTNTTGATPAQIRDKLNGVYDDLYRVALLPSAERARYFVDTMHNPELKFYVAAIISTLRSLSDHSQPIDESFLSELGTEAQKILNFSETIDIKLDEFNLLLTGMVVLQRYDKTLLSSVVDNDPLQALKVVFSRVGAPVVPPALWQKDNLPSLLTKLRAMGYEDELTKAAMIYFYLTEDIFWRSYNYHDEALSVETLMSEFSLWFDKILAHNAKLDRLAEMARLRHDGLSFVDVNGMTVEKAVEKIKDCIHLYPEFENYDDERLTRYVVLIFNRHLEATSMIGTYEQSVKTLLIRDAGQRFEPIPTFTSVAEADKAYQTLMNGTNTERSILPGTLELHLARSSGVQFMGAVEQETLWQEIKTALADAPDEVKSSVRLKWRQLIERGEPAAGAVKRMLLDFKQVLVDKLIRESATGSGGSVLQAALQQHAAKPLEIFLEPFTAALKRMQLGDPIQEPFEYAQERRLAQIEPTPFFDARAFAADFLRSHGVTEDEMETVSEYSRPSDYGGLEERRNGTLIEQTIDGFEAGGLTSRLLKLPYGKVVLLDTQMEEALKDFYLGQSASAWGVAQGLERARQKGFWEIPSVIKYESECAAKELYTHMRGASHRQSAFEKLEGNAEFLAGFSTNPLITSFLIVEGLSRGDPTVLFNAVTFLSPEALDLLGDMLDSLKTGTADVQDMIRTTGVPRDTAQQVASMAHSMHAHRLSLADVQDLDVIQVSPLRLGEKVRENYPDEVVQLMARAKRGEKGLYWEGMPVVQLANGEPALLKKSGIYYYQWDAAGRKPYAPLVWRDVNEQGEHVYYTSANALRGGSLQRKFGRKLGKYISNNKIYQQTSVRVKKLDFNLSEEDFSNLLRQITISSDSLQSTNAFDVLNKAFKNSEIFRGCANWLIKQQRGDGAKKLSAGVENALPSLTGRPGMIFPQRNSLPRGYWSQTGMVEKTEEQRTIEAFLGAIDKLAPVEAVGSGVDPRTIWTQAILNQMTSGNPAPISSAEISSTRWFELKRLGPQYQNVDLDAARKQSGLLMACTSEILDRLPITADTLIDGTKVCERETNKQLMSLFARLSDKRLGPDMTCKELFHKNFELAEGGASGVGNAAEDLQTLERFFEHFSKDPLFADITTTGLESGANPWKIVLNKQLAQQQGHVTSGVNKETRTLYLLEEGMAHISAAGIRKTGVQDKFLLGVLEAAGVDSLPKDLARTNQGALAYCRNKIVAGGYVEKGWGLHGGPDQYEQGKIKSSLWLLEEQINTPGGQRILAGLQPYAMQAAHMEKDYRKKWWRFWEYYMSA